MFWYGFLSLRNRRENRVVFFVSDDDVDGTVDLAEEVLVLVFFGDGGKTRVTSRPVCGMFNVGWGISKRIAVEMSWLRGL